MNPESVVQDLESRGVRLEARNDRLYLDAPKGAVTEELRSYLSEHKSEVLEILVVRERDRRKWTELLTWATELGNRDRVLGQPITFHETDLRQVTTGRISEYARQYLRTIASAEMARRGLNWEPWSLGWHEEQAREAMQSLTNMRAALEDRE